MSQGLLVFFRNVVPGLPQNSQSQTDPLMEDSVSEVGIFFSRLTCIVHGRR